MDITDLIATSGLFPGKDQSSPTIEGNGDQLTRCITEAPLFKAMGGRKDESAENVVGFDGEWEDFKRSVLSDLEAFKDAALASDIVTDARYVDNPGMLAKTVISAGLYKLAAEYRPAGPQFKKDYEQLKNL